ncbi:MAG: cell wall-binding repeat-containing protein, partial [Firmicutes bacterium]|nr:cell wall-binding repeat-containing protein [Bacillota bacterium]
TSTLIARYFFTSPDRAVLAYAMNFPDGLSGGPLAYAMGGPLILASNGHSAVAAEYMKDANIRVGSVLGGPTLISDDEVRTIFKLAPSIEVIEK